MIELELLGTSADGESLVLTDDLTFRISAAADGQDALRCPG